MTGNGIRVRVSMFIEAAPSQVYQAFVEPDWLTQFWLAEASGPLEVGQQVTWRFMVPGAEDKVSATKLDPARHIGWRWSSGDEVRIDLEALEDGTAVTLVSDGFQGDESEKLAASLDGTEGFSIVLCDLKTLLENGRSAGLAKGKAKLIAARR